MDHMKSERKMTFIMMAIAWLIQTSCDLSVICFLLCNHSLPDQFCSHFYAFEKVEECVCRLELTIKLSLFIVALFLDGIFFIGLAAS